MNKVDLLKCPECKGSGKSGQFDRCIPPNEYECEVCNGTGYKICCENCHWYMELTDSCALNPGGRKADWSEYICGRFKLKDPPHRHQRIKE